MKSRSSRLIVAITVLALCIASIFTVAAFAATGIETEGEMKDITSKLSEYLVQDTKIIADDGYVGAIQYTVYYDGSKGNAISGYGGTPVIVYAVNTNTERVGTDSNENIIRSMLGRGYIVVVTDYLGSSKACGQKLDDSADLRLRHSFLTPPLP